LFTRPIPHEELYLLGAQVGPTRDAYPNTPNTSQTYLLEFPVGEPDKGVLPDLPFVLRVVLYQVRGVGRGCSSKTSAARYSAMLVTEVLRLSSSCVQITTGARPSSW
jgi:hypothetical protein